MTSPLFTSVHIGGRQTPHRVVMAPMTRGQSPGGIPGPNVAAYYRRRAEYGVGLILTEGTGIDRPESLGMPDAVVVEPPNLVESGIHRRLHLDPVIPIQGNGIGRAHGIGALFEPQEFLLPVSRRKRQQKQN
jgi:hypothetical protein